jgi:hypothetical protein
VPVQKQSGTANDGGAALDVHVAARFDKRAEETLRVLDALLRFRQQLA